MLRLIPRRPVLGENLDIYRGSISAVPENVASVSVLSGDDARRAAFTLMRSVYGRSDAAPLARVPMIEDALFALWSQQWPRLRRHFSFRTAVSSHGSPRELRFDVQILALAFPTSRGDDSSPSDWEGIAVSDLFQLQPSEFRRFLWRYGSDVLRVFDSFKVLAQLFMGTSVDRLEGVRQRQILVTVANAFPDARDARLLKSDLLAFSRNPYSRVPEIDALGAWEFLVEQSSTDQLPIASASDGELLVEYLKSRPEDVIRIAEKAVGNSSLAAQRYISIFANTLTPATFWSTTAKSGGLMRAVAAVRPELLDRQELSRLSSSDLVAILELCSFDDILARHIVGRLLRLDDPAVVGVLWNKHDKVVIDTIVDGGASSGAAEAWTNLIEEHSERWVVGDVLSRAVRSGAIGGIVEKLSPEAPSVLAAGAQPWVAALGAASNSVDALGLLTFVLVVALKIGEPDSEYLFERAFEPVYEGIKRHRIPPRLLDRLIQALPNVPSWKQWDICYRLTLAVARAYVNRRGNIEKFAAAISEWYVERSFLRLVERIERGEFCDDEFSEDDPLDH
jgi:hypothetical protein